MVKCLIEVPLGDRALLDELLDALVHLLSHLRSLYCALVNRARLFLMFVLLLHFLINFKKLFK